MDRWVTVDDTDSNIQYSGSWSLNNGQSYDTQGNFGAPYMSSLHSITGGQASFSYSFDGADGQVFGTNNVKTSNGVQDPTWECAVDGTTITLTTPFPYVENNWILCSWNSTVVPPGKHTLTVTAKSNSQAFLFDYFRFVPSSAANYQNTAFYVPFNDPAIQYGEGWSNLGTIAQMATNGGAVVTIPFYGTGLMWFGDTPVELPSGSTTAEYTIDGKSATTFNLPGNPGGTTQYTQLVFQTGSLSLGWHTLVVTSQGTTSLTPLVLGNLIIQGGSTQPPSVSTAGSSTGLSPTTSSITSLPASARSSTGLPGSSSTSQIGIAATPGISDAVSFNGNTGSTAPTVTSGTSSSSTANSSLSGANVINATHGLPIGAIVGGVLGGIAIILLVLALFCYRRRTTKNRELVYSEQVRPFYRDIPPSRIPEDADSGSYSPQQAAQIGNNRGFFSANEAQGGSSSSSYDKTNSVVNPAHPYSPGQDPYSSMSALGSDASRSTAASFYVANPAHTYSSGQDPFSSESALSSPTTAGGSTSLLQPKSTQAGHANTMAITHEDSGYRMPRPNIPPPPIEIVEYPPVYTPA